MRINHRHMIANNLTTNYQNIFQFSAKSILAGIFISIGAAAYLSIGMPFGPIVFAFGLVSVILTQTNLFTGKSGFIDSYWELIPMIILNAVGCYLVSLLYDMSTLDISNIIQARLNTEWYVLIGKSILTGIIMTVSVYYAKNKNWLPLLLGIPAFIMAGLPHCVADCFYYGLYGWKGDIIIPWILSIIGNFIGCNFHRILKITL